MINIKKENGIIEIDDGIRPYTITSKPSIYKRYDGVTVKTEDESLKIIHLSSDEVSTFNIDGDIITINNSSDLYNAFKKAESDKTDLYFLFSEKVISESGTVVSTECITNYAY